MTTHHSIQLGANALDEFKQTPIKDAFGADTRLLAQHLDKTHKSVFEMVETYKLDFEKFGILGFQKVLIQGRSQPQKFVLLNEDQCYLLLTYTRNTARIRQLKLNLGKAFGETHRTSKQRQTEYLTTYHQLHDELHSLAAGSEHESCVHVNVNRLINKTVGLKAGQWSALHMPQQSLLTVAQSVAAGAARGAPDHREGYQRIKHALLALLVATTGSLSTFKEAEQSLIQIGGEA